MARGSIYPYQLADGSQRYMVMYRSTNGVLRKKSGFEGRRAAERFLNSTMEAVDGGRVVATRETFADYIDGWLREHRARIEEGTYRDYRTHIERRLKPYFGAMKLSEITAVDVRRYVAELVEGSSAGAALGRSRLAAARAACARLEELTIADLAAAVGEDAEVARGLVRRLEPEGVLERAGGAGAPMGAAAARGSIGRPVSRRRASRAASARRFHRRRSTTRSSRFGSHSRTRSRTD